MEHTIYPYMDGQRWFFDDASTGLFREELVFGTDVIIHELARKFRGFRKGVKLRFSDVEFPGAVALRWVRAERPGVGGDWYVCDKLNKEGWLCPALALYFSPSPKVLYISVSRKDAVSSGVLLSSR